MGGPPAPHQAGSHILATLARGDGAGGEHGLCRPSQHLCPASEEAEKVVFFLQLVSINRGQPCLRRITTRTTTAVPIVWGAKPAANPKKLSLCTGAVPAGAPWSCIPGSWSQPLLAQPLFPRRDVPEGMREPPGPVCASGCAHPRMCPCSVHQGVCGVGGGDFGGEKQRRPHQGTPSRAAPLLGAAKDAAGTRGGGWGHPCPGTTSWRGSFPSRRAMATSVSPDPLPRTSKCSSHAPKRGKTLQKIPPPRVFRALGTRGLPRQPTVPAASVPGSHPGERAGF